MGIAAGYRGGVAQCGLFPPRTLPFVPARAIGAGQVGGPMSRAQWLI